MPTVRCPDLEGGSDTAADHEILGPVGDDNTRSEMGTIRIGDVSKGSDGRCCHQ